MTSGGDEQPALTFQFGPPEQPTSLGVRPSQAVVIVIGVAAGLGLVAALPIAAAPLGFVPIIAALVVALVPVGGTLITDRVALRTAWRITRLRRRQRWQAPLASLERGVHHDAYRGKLSLPAGWGRYRIVPVSQPAGYVGVLIDEQRRTAAATLVARADAFPLLDRQDQERRAQAWGGVIAALARDEHAVRRIGWVERTVPAEADEISGYLAAHRDRTTPLDSASVLSYVELIESSTAAALEHECFITIQLEHRARAAQIRQRGAARQPWPETLAGLCVEELRLLAQSLEGRDVCAVGALPPRLLAAAVRHATDPAARPHLARLSMAGADEGCAAEVAGPSAVEASWDAVRTDSAWHAVFAVTRCPARDVSVLFLAPLLARTQAQRSVAVVCEPVAPSRALREAEHDRARQEEDESTRERLGFIRTARGHRRSQAAGDRERDLVNGHALVRFAAYVTVSADTRQALDHSCAEVLQAAQHAHLELRRLVGRQHIALTYALPGLCAGL